MPDTSYQSPFPVRCEGGLILERSIFDLAPGAALRLLNFEPDINGGYRRVTGYAKWNTNTVSGTGKVLGTFIFGANVVACRGANVEYAATGAGAWTSITTGRTNAGRYHFDRFNFSGTNKMIMADGVNPAATWDGSSYVLMNGASGSGSGVAPTAPSFVQEFQNHMFYLQGRKLYWSAPYQENNHLPSDGAGEINLASEGSGLMVHHDELIVFCADRIFRLVGTGRESFNVTNVTKDLGCLSGYSVQEIGGDLIFLGPDGLRLLSTTSQRINEELGSVSKNIQPRFQSIVHDLICSTVIREKTQYRIFYPTSDGQLDTQAEGNTAVIKSTGWEFGDLKGIKPSCCDSYWISGNEIIVHGGYDGYVYQQESGNSFSTDSISYEFQSPHIIMGDAGMRKNMQRVILNFDTEGDSDFSLTPVYDYGDTDVPQTTSYAVSVSSGSVYGSSVYGTALYGGTDAPLIRQTVEGSGFSVSIKISGSSTDDASFSIKGFQLEFTQGGRR